MKTRLRIYLRKQPSSWGPLSWRIWHELPEAESDRLVRHLVADNAVGQIAYLEARGFVEFCDISGTWRPLQEMTIDSVSSASRRYVTR